MKQKHKCTYVQYVTVNNTHNNQPFEKIIVIIIILKYTYTYTIKILLKTLLL